LDQFEYFEKKDVILVNVNRCRYKRKLEINIHLNILNNIIFLN